MFKKTAMLLGMAVATSSPFSLAEANGTESTAPTEAQVQAKEERNIKAVAGLGLTFGGDDLVQAWYEDGSSEKLEAGGLIDLKFGAQYSPKGSNYALQGTMGYHFDSMSADNGDASFSRIPLDLIAFLKHEKHRFGAGLSYNTATELDSGGAIDFGKIKFDDATGLLLEYGYAYRPNLVFAARYLSIDYQASSFPNAPSVNGDHAGLYAYILF